MQSLQTPPERAICYIDGFNLYFGLSQAGLRKYLWLDVHDLAKSLLSSHQKLVKTKYFTARITGARPQDSVPVGAQRNAKRKRQADYLDALGAIDGLTVYEGKYHDNKVCCRDCGKTWYKAEEKMTDVNIATEMLLDAFRDEFDVAILVSGDTDLVPPIKAIHSAFPQKRIVVAFPPNRGNKQLKQEASHHFVIWKKSFRDNQMPQQVRMPNGYIITRPSGWQ